MQTFPTLFLSHRSPMMALDPGPTGAMFSRLAGALGKPRAIVMVSGHHLTAAPEVGMAARPETIYDFFGFPPPLYQIKYPAPGAVDIGEQILQRLHDAGIAARPNPQRGLDHGAWSPLLHMFPDADIPVVPLSIQPRMDARHHYAMGCALADLGSEGVLVIGSGNLTHNLRDIVRWEREAETTPYVAEFQSWFAERLAAHDIDALLDWERSAPHGSRAHPTDDHLLPIFVALGAGGESAVTQRLYAGVDYGVLAMDAFAFGAATVALERFI